MKCSHFFHRSQEIPLDLAIRYVAQAKYPPKAQCANAKRRRRNALVIQSKYPPLDGLSSGTALLSVGRLAVGSLLT